MNKQLVRHWVEVLRSGKYEQGRTRLRDINNKYCCLGVLCDITKDKINLHWKISNRLYIIDGSYNILPNSISSFLGIDNAVVSINSSNSKLQKYLDSYELKQDSTNLIVLNDQYKLSFKQIADILEEEFLTNENKTTDMA